MTLSRGALKRCYEAGPRCKCQKESCGGVERIRLDCPEHGEDVVSLRVHNCSRRNAHTEEL